MSSSSSTTVTAEDWIKGITLSVIASIIGGASKLAIRKSWMIVAQLDQIQQAEEVALYHTESVGSTTTRDSFSSHQEDESNHQDEDEENDEDADGERPQDRLVRSRSLRHRTLARQSMEAGLMVGVPPTLPPSTPPRSRALRRPSLLPPSRGLAYCLRLSGMLGMTFLNPLCGVWAMNYASPSILAPFSGLTLVWIVTLSPPLIGEHPSPAQVLAAAFIVLGEVVVAVYGDHTNDAGVTVEDVRQSYLYPPFLAYFVTMTAWMALLFYWILQPTETNVLRKRFVWGVAGGSITGLQNFLKDSLTVLKAVHIEQESSQVDGTYPVFFFVLIGLAVTCAFVGLVILTACMKRYDATFSSAMFVGSFVISASAMSVIHYQTFQHLTSWMSLLMYPTGLVVLMGGVYMLLQESKEGSELLDVSARLPLARELSLPPIGDSVANVSLEGSQERMVLS